jgi:hypothetical protein
MLTVLLAMTEENAMSIEERISVRTSMAEILKLARLHEHSYLSNVEVESAWRSREMAPSSATGLADAEGPTSSRRAPLPQGY